MLKKLANALLLCATCILLLSLLSCQVSDKGLFTYSKDSFSAVAEGSVDGIAVKATVSFERSADGELGRVMTVRYDSPESLSGLVVTVFSDGTVTARLGDTEIGEGAFSGLATPFLAICPQGEYSSIALDGGGNATAEFSQEGSSVKYYFKSGTRLPAKIEGRSHGRRISLKLSEK